MKQNFNEEKIMKMKRFMIGLVAVLLATLSVGFGVVTAAENDERSVAGVAINTPTPAPPQIPVDPDLGTISGTWSATNSDQILDMDLLIYQWVAEGTDGGGHWGQLGSQSMRTGYLTFHDYYIAELAPGAYRVCLRLYSQDYVSFDTMCYGGGATPEEGADVVAVAGEITTGIDLQFDTLGSDEQASTVIIPSLTVDGGGEIQDGSLVIYVSSSGGGRQYVEGYQVVTAGYIVEPYTMFEFDRLPQGRYDLCYEEIVAPVGDEQNRYSGCIEVVLGAGETRVFDIVIDSVTSEPTIIQKEFGTISGRLIAPSNAGILDASIYLYQWEEGAWVETEVRQTFVEGESSYQFPYVHPGTYRVCASAFGEYRLRLICHGGSHDPANGLDIVVGNGDNITGIDIDFNNRPSGIVTGVVTDDDGNPLADHKC